MKIIFQIINYALKIHGVNPSHSFANDTDKTTKQRTSRFNDEINVK